MLLQLCQMVGALHRRGWLHRDIKPQNVLCRADGTPVLADFGLVKAIAPDGARAVLAMTQVAGRGVGSGTPYFGAPEQFRGEALSPSVDIHALGVFIDTCFEGRPPRAWERIVSRATSSLPERRYAEVIDLAQAIRRRHWPKVGLAVAASLSALLPVAFFWPARIAKRAEALAALPPVLRTQQDEAARWQQMGHLATRTEQEEVTVREEWKDLANDPFFESSEPVKVLALREYRIETREIEVWEVPLNGQIVRFEQPLTVSAKREVRLVGPGTLDAQLVGEPEAKIVLEAGAILLNRSSLPLEQAKISYRVGDGCYLNFTSLDETYTARDFVEGGYLAFRGPDTIKELRDRCQRQWYEEIEREYGRQ
ncbi:MAG: serine/threonine protein kinase [Candidatus Spyradenecus sp.]